MDAIVYADVVTHVAGQLIDINRRRSAPANLPIATPPTTSTLVARGINGNSFLMTVHYDRSALRSLSKQLHVKRQALALASLHNLRRRTCCSSRRS